MDKPDIEGRLEQLGLVLPAKLTTPTEVRLPFKMVRVRGNIAYVSGHGPQHEDGSTAGPFGKVGADISLEQAYDAAKSTALSILASIKRELGTLDNVYWLKALGMVNAAPGFNQTPAVINGFSDLILELYGAEQGGHARSAIGVAELPFDIPVEIEAMVEVL